MSTFYGTAEAAPKLGVKGARGVEALCRSQAIEHYRFESPGGRVTYKLSQEQIDAYLNARRVKAS